MTEGEARSRLAHYLQELIGGDTNYQPPASWADETPRAERRDTGGHRDSSITTRVYTRGDDTSHPGALDVLDPPAAVTNL